MIGSAVLLAASISITSTAFPALISVQLSHTSHGSAVGLSADPIAFRQFKAIARMRAIVVFPITRWPLKIYPCAIRPWVSAFISVTVTWSCPTTSANRWGRYLRAKT